MARFNIPDEHKKGFEYFISLDDDLREKLIDEIERAPIGLSPIKLAAHLSLKTEIKKNELNAIVETLFSLYGAKENTGIELNVFLEGIIEALSEIGLKPDKRLKSQLQKFLGLRGFYITFKAINLATEKEKILIGSTILTDIRPVFDERNGLDIKCSLITHSLKIEYREDSDFKEIYFALDSNDLIKLKEYIFRAEEKEAVVRRKFENSNISFLDIE